MGFTALLEQLNSCRVVAIDMRDTNDASRRNPWTEVHR